VYILMGWKGKGGERMGCGVLAVDGVELPGRVMYNNARVPQFAL
jgi:hypothetical protein